MAFGKLFFRVFVIGGQVISRAVLDAYRQTVKNASGNSNLLKSGLSIGGMTLEEAAKILNVEKTSTHAEIMKKYEHLFKLNDKNKGGSFYLQSKVVRARERFELEWKQKPTQLHGGTNDSSSSQ